MVGGQANDHSKDAVCRVAAVTKQPSAMIMNRDFTGKTPAFPTILPIVLSADVR